MLDDMDASLQSLVPEVAQSEMADDVSVASVTKAWRGVVVRPACPRWLSQLLHPRPDISTSAKRRDDLLCKEIEDSTVIITLSTLQTIRTTQNINTQHD